MKIADHEVKKSRPHQAVAAALMIAVLMLSAGATYADDPPTEAEKAYQSCINAIGIVGCSGTHRPVPEVVNDLWNAIAYSPSRNVAAFAGSFTAPENAKAAALKACAARASDCRIVGAAHDICLAVAFELSAGGRYRAATGASKQDAEGNALPVCMAEGPKRCSVLASCTGTPPQLIVTK